MEHLSARVRSLVTLVVLGLLLVTGLAWGWSSVTEPFPEKLEAPLCVESTLGDGDVLRPGSITISVLNAGDRSGLAGRTRGDLVDQGFAKGQLANAPDDVEALTAQIWTTDGRDPVVQLVRSYLGGKVRVVERAPIAAGVNIVVGDRFEGVRKGRQQVRLDQEVTVCSPPDLS